MCWNFSYPYTLSKKENAIKLEIRARNSCSILLYLAAIFLFITQVVVCMYIMITFRWLPWKYYLVGGLYIVIIMATLSFTIYILNWKLRGKEIFILYRDRLENFIENKPFKMEKHTYFFEKLEIGYQSGEDFFSEEEAKLLEIELDIEKVEGFYPIQFYMDEGKQIVDSERTISIEAARKLKKEFWLLNSQK